MKRENGQVRTIWQQYLFVLLLALMLFNFGSVAAAGQHALSFDWNSSPGVLNSFSMVGRRPNRDMSRRTELGAMDCLDALIYADTDNNRQVNSSEYLTFLNVYGPENFLSENVVEFDDLPLVFKSNFLILACLCLQQTGAEEDCCVGDAAHIDNMGAAPDETPTSEQEKYFSQVCFLTETSIIRYIASSSPTTSPLAPVLPTAAPLQTTPLPSPATDVPSFVPPPPPTGPPTAKPSQGPTFEPTFQPVSQNATLTPAPTGFVVNPGSPTDLPLATSTGPSSSPSAMATGSTPSPTETPAVDVVAHTTYVIAMPAEEALSRAAYRADLTAAMDLLASHVAANMTLDDGGRLLQQLLRSRQRRLSGVTVDIPTSVDGIIATVCPETVSGNDRCEDVSASIGLFLDELSGFANETAVKVAFEVDLNYAIEDGALQKALTATNPNSPVYIVTGDGGGTPSFDDDMSNAIPPDDSRDLSGGAISGIVVGGMAGILVVMGLLSRRRQQYHTDEYYLKENQSTDVEELTAQKQNMAVGTSPTSIQHEANEAGLAAGVAVAAMVGSAAASKSRKSKDSKRVDSAASAEKADSDAGSSGWSSREGMSSLESVADEETKGSSRCDTTASAQSLPQQTALASTEAPTGGEDSNLAYTELDQAIQKGDWAAVGVTAALLASQSHSSAQDSPEKRVNFQGYESRTRAAEMDSLVQAGDWAGVVAAAAKYDAQENVTLVRSGSRTSEAGSSAGSVGSTGTGRSAFSGSGTAITAGSGAFTSTGTTTSDTNSRVKKLDEIRAEVQQLVEKVVPEEKDNIDEMMMQFRGREEELVETLRTMQEREVAQKARLEGQKRAKRDARHAVEQNKFFEKQYVAAASIAKDDSWIREIDDTPPDGVNAEIPSEKQIGSAPTETLLVKEDEDMGNQVSEMQGALKQAIESEDWEKVAETAAELSQRLGENAGDESDASTNATDKSQEINALVDKGDWDGVVAAASREVFGEASEFTAADSEVDAERQAKRQQRLKEEQEALEQANIWSAIAEQTKKGAEADSEANQAATVAADWAIARSLSELKKAEKESGRMVTAEGGGSDDDDVSDSGGSNKEEDQERTI